LNKGFANLRAKSRLTVFKKQIKYKKPFGLRETDCKGLQNEVEHLKHFIV